VSAPPVLWHLKASHYNEKVRWALDFKGVPHERRALTAGFHPRKARRLTGEPTTPILEVDGEAIGDSTRIIAALEERHPDPPLYPADPAERARALELEDVFDEELGPYCRRLVFHHLLTDRELVIGAFMPDFGPVRRGAMRAAFGAVRPRLEKEFEITDENVDRAFGKLRETGERFRAEVGPSGYLVGDRFTVADLTLAALLAPPVAPEQFPYPQPQRDHPRMEPVREVLAEYGLVEWTRDMYARHRPESAEIGG
jgi:glutathione S-transferase